MRGFLLDTNVALLASSHSAALSRQARQALINGPNFLSVLSYWEVLLKSMKGKLRVGDPRSWWALTLEQLRATPLPLRPEHIHGVYKLPAIHLDPFDRALISQSMEEDLTFITTDQLLPKYASDRFHVIQ